MRSISIISKLTGVKNNVEASEITLKGPSIVELKIEREEVASFTRSGQDLVIKLHSGETITIKNYYAFADQGGNQLVLEGHDGVLWWVQDPETAAHYEQIANIDAIMTATGAHAEGGAIWPWVLGGLAVAAGGAIAAASSGGGGHSDSGTNPGNPGRPDVTPPPAPTGLAISADGKTITGNAEAGSTVTIKDANGNVVGTGIAGSDGNFTVTLTSPQVNGGTLTATATDPSGNTGPGTNITAPNIPLPDEPHITNIVNDTPGTGGNINNNASTNDNTPTLNGTGQAGSTVHIYDNGVQIGTVVVGTNGTWSFTPGTPLADGAHVFTAIATSDRGESTTSPAYTITIDTVPPAAATDLAVSADGDTLTGHAEAGSTVTVKDAYGNVIGTGTAGTDGSFTIPLTTPQITGGTLTVTATDSAGNTGPGATITAPNIPLPEEPSITSVINDNPNAPDGGNVGNNSPTNDNTPTLNGTGQAGTTIHIYDNGAQIGTVVVGTGGTWSFTPGSALADGAHVFTATASNERGETAPSPAYTVTIDTAPPGPASGLTVSPDGETLTGHAEAGSTITIKDPNGVVVGTGTTDSNGNINITLTTPQVDGETLTVVVTDPAGNNSPPANVTAPDVLPPVLPAITGVLDDVAPVTGNVGNNQATNDTTPTVQGTGQPGDTIHIFANGTEIGTVKVGLDSTWSFTPQTPLGEGSYTFTASASNVRGDSGTSVSYTITIDTTPPLAPTGLAISADGATLTGNAEHGSTVTIKDASGNVIGTGTADPVSGAFTVTLTTPQLDGGQVSVVASDSAGNVGPAGTTTAPFFPLPTVPVITEILDNVPPIVGPVQNNQPTNDQTPTLQGTGVAGETIHIFDNGIEIGTTLVLPGGNWSFTPVSILPDGPHSFTATASNIRGDSGSSGSFTVIVDTIVNPPVLDQILDTVGSITGPIGNNGITDDNKPAFSGTGEAGSTLTIFDNGLPIGQVTVGNDGNWTFTPTVALADGPHAITLQQTDPAGNVSTVTVGPTFTVDTIPPIAVTIDNVSLDGTTITGTGEAGDTVKVVGPNGVVLGTAQIDQTGNFTLTLNPAQTHGGTLTAQVQDAAGNVGPDTTFPASNSGFPTVPVLVSVTDDVGPIQGPLTNGQATDDSRPTLSGTAEPGTTSITIFDNNIPLGIVTPDASGNWSFTPLAPLPDGPHSFTFSATNANGTSAISTPFGVVVDTTPPGLPTGLTVSNDGTTLTGTAEANSKVTITNASGTVLGTATADGTGHFSVTLNPAQLNGEILTAKATDAAGNTGLGTSIPAPDHTAPNPPTGLAVSADGLHVTGTAEPNSTVTVWDGNGNVIGTGIASGTGTFDISPLVPPQLNGETLMVTATDAANNTSSPAAVIAQDHTPPALPTNLTFNEDGSILTGKAEAGSTVKVTDALGNPLGQAVAGPDGSFTITLTTPQANGQHLEVNATDAAGNIGQNAPITAPDITPPNIPIIGSVIDNVPEHTGGLNNGDLTNDDKPTISGTAEANSTVKIYDNGTLIGTVNADGTGAWTFTPGTSIGQGLHSLTVTATDAAGNTSQPSAAFNINVDSIAPTAPTITQVYDDVGVVTGPVSNNGATNDPTPTLSGSGEPGSTITVYDGLNVLGTTTVNNNGTWTFTPTTPLLEGPHTFTVTASDAAGNVTAPSAPWNIELITTLPTAPTIGEIVDNVNPDTGPILPGGSTNDPQPVINGTAGANAVVKIYDGTTLIGTVTANGSGAWTFQPTQPLSEGSHTLNVYVTDAAGNTSSATTQIVVIDTTPPGAPSIDGALGNVANAPATLVNGGSTQSTEPVFSGKGEIGATITLYADGGTTPIGTAIVDGSGNWTITPTAPLGSGTHVFTTTATDAAGNVGVPSSGFTLSVYATPPVTPSAPTVTDNVPPVVGAVIPGGSTNDTTPTFSGTGVAGSTINIYNNGNQLIGTTTVRSDGTWSVDPSTPLGEATYNITVQVTDPAGNISLPSAPIAITVDTTPPGAPVIGSADDGVGPVTGPITNGITDDPKPVFHGTGEIGATVTLYNGSTAIGSAVVDGLGNWTITPNIALNNGLNTITAVQTDKAGNVGSPSVDYDLTVDTVPLTAPVVVEIIDNVGPIQTPLVNGSFTDDTTPTFTGTGKVGSTVTLYDTNGTTILGTGVVGANGTWSITTSVLPEGAHSITVKAVDDVGNSVGPSAPIVINVDTTPPGVPFVLPITDPTGTLVAGTAEPGATVIIKDAGGNILGTGVAAPITGAWTVTLSPAQTTGATLTAIAQDPAGNQSAGVNFTATTSVLPHPPTIDLVDDNVGPITGNVGNGKSTDDTLPTLSGSGAAAGGVVHIYIDGALFTSVPVGAGGTWTYQLTTPLPQGTHTFAVSQTVGLETSGLSAPYTIIVDTTPPPQPIIVSVVDAVAGGVVGPLTNGQATNDPKPTLSGTAEAGSTVNILDNGAIIGTVTANALGIWSFTPTTSLGEGPHTLTVTATDAAGNVSVPSTNFVVNVDTLPPATPVVVAVTNDITSQPITSGQPTNDNTPTFSGTAEAGTTLTFKDGNVIIGTVTVPVGGNWTFTPSVPLLDGSHNITVISTDAAGNVSGPTAGFNVVVDTVPPIVPIILSVVDDQTQPGTNLPLINGQLTKDTQPTLSGTAEANATITVKDGNTVLGTTQADGLGNWTFTPTAPLGQGTHTLNVTATDAAGNVSNAASFGVNIDSVAPNPPVIVTVLDNTAPVLGPITNGQATNETRPSLSGTAEAGAIIKVYSDGNLIGTTLANGSGAWSLTPVAALGSGAHTLTVTATDAAGNVSNPSNGFSLTVDTVAPNAPVISSVTDAVGPIVGGLSNGQVTDDTRPTLTGTAEGNATVSVYDNGVLLGTAQADPGGAWTFRPSTPLINGGHALTVTATDAAGNVSLPSTPFNVVVDTIAPTQPIVVQAFDDVGPVQGPLVSGSTTDDTQPALSGTAEANSTINIYDNGNLIGTVTTTALGAWSFTPGTALPLGQHVFTVTATDAAGNTSVPSAGFTLTLASGVSNTPVLTSVVDDVAGGTVGPLTSGQATNDPRPTLNGTADANSTIKIYDGGNLIGTVTANALGIWVFTPPTALANGSHTFTITATNGAGVVSSPTAGFSIVVDTVAPNQPAITSVVDDVGPITGPVGNNQPTDDTRPTLNGTAEANATVNIFDNGVLLGTTTANGSGVWTFTPTLPLLQGNHSFTVTATDAAGNVSVPSVPAGIIVDTVPPLAPTGLTVNATGTVVTGVAEANSKVTVTSATGTVLGTAQADGNGNFSITLSPAQTSAQPLLAFAQDAAGNIGVSASFTAPFTGVPGLPVITSIVDDVLPKTGVVGNGQSTNDTRPTINGTAEANATVKIYDNGALLGTVTANASGVWTFTPTGALGDGVHAFTATATNANGTGGASLPTSVIVDTIPPLIPTGVISADGSTITGVAEANSTVTITLPGGITVTGTANASGAFSITLPTRQIEGQSLSISAADAAGNVSPSLSITAPILPLSASSNVIDMALTSNATITTEHYSGYGTLLIGALGSVGSVLGSNTAQVGFTIGSGATGHITINAAATGVVLSLLNTLEIAIQKYDAATNSWTTVVDSSLPQFLNLLTLGATGVTLNLDGLGEGQYRVLGYNTSLLAVGATTNLAVTVEETGPGVVSGATTSTGNVITDPGPGGAVDNAPAGTVVTSVTDANGVSHTVGAGGLDLQGKYGTLHINQDGSYTYTLTNTSAAVLGRTENFTYTITHNGVSDSAQLIVTLGNGAPASTVTATDNTGSLTFGTDVAAVDHGASQQTGLSVLSVGLGNVVNLNLLANMSNPILFDVADGSTRTMTLQASVGGVALLSTFDLYIYKFNAATQQYEQFQVQKTWLTAPLLGGSSGQLTVTLGGGDYLFLLMNASGVSLLTSYTLNILQDHTYAVDSLAASTTGNVMQDDIAPAGSLLTAVNGVSVSATGTTTIVGKFGTLTIDAQGNYTYTLKAGQGADGINTPDSFVYTVTAPNGDTGTASLNITATPHTVDAVNDISSIMAITSTQNTAAYASANVGSASWNTALLASTHGNGSGTFTIADNTVLSGAALVFKVASGLALGGLSVTWTLSDGQGHTYTGTFSGGVLLGGTATIPVTDLHSGTWTLSYVGNMGPLSVGTITVTPTVTGTSHLLDSFTAQSTIVHGNLYDGTDSAGAADQLGSVHTLMTITGANGSTATLNPMTNSDAVATIQGQYGTLTIGIGGNYTYTLNPGVSPGSITNKEVFTYTLNDQNGHSDSATLTINMNPQIVSTAYGDIINGSSAYADTLVYHVLAGGANDGTGGNGSDVWKNFSLTQGDQINIHDLLVGWNGQTSTLGNYLSVATVGNNTVISIDRDGTAGAFHSTTLVTLENVHTTLDELIQNNHIVA
ncbi:BapA/Bap/LapF family large adhesin [Cedecea lapagei]|uniref:BapA/Bap/LapF family large adhesin n=1 Tax=Cedecea lapagei TaxID=158823 RepID=UPI001BCDFE1F|nr:BapA/Bap/LapF family large adhesin [Cedecea lapagei]